MRDSFAAKAALTILLVSYSENTSGKVDPNGVGKRVR